MLRQPAWYLQQLFQQHGGFICSLGACLFIAMVFSQPARFGPIPRLRFWHIFEWRWRLVCSWLFCTPLHSAGGQGSHIAFALLIFSGLHVVLAAATLRAVCHGACVALRQLTYSWWDATSVGTCLKIIFTWPSICQ